MQLMRVIDVLTDSCCRRILYYLAAQKQDGDSITIDELARYVKAAETGYRSETLVRSEYTDVRHTLLHTQLPRLREAGFIEVDSQSETVEFRWSSHILLAAVSLSHRIKRVV